MPTQNTVLQEINKDAYKWVDISGLWIRDLTVIKMPIFPINL